MSKALILILIFGLSACNKVDDYMLGKDNTPHPKELAPLKTKNHLVEKWSVASGHSKKNSSYLKLKPVILNKTVYTADAGGVVQAIHNHSGEPIWTKTLTTPIISGPVIAQGLIIIGTDNSKIIALNQENGQKIWQKSVSGDVLAKPIAAQGKVIAKTIDGNLYALDLKTGKELWVSEHGAPSLILKASSSPVIVDNKMVLVGYSDGKMDAVDLQTGQVLWQRSIAYATGASDVERLVDIDADPIVEGDVALLASYQGYVGALSLSNGQFIWRKPASTYSNIVTRGNSLYMTDSNDIVWSINKQNGQVNWKQVKLKARGLTEPSLVGDYLVIGDKTGILHVLSTKNGEFLSRTQLSGPINIAPGVAGSNVFVMTANGKLSRFSVS